MFLQTSLVLQLFTTCFTNVSIWWSVSQEDQAEKDFTTYTVLKLEKNTAQINNLLPGTKYVFRVQTLTPEGHPSSHSAEHEFETAPLGKTVCKCV